MARGIDVSGKKHPLALVEGDTENATVVKDLLIDLRERGLDVRAPILVVIDGAKALSSAVRAVFDHPVVHRCQLHKIRNVESKLPKHRAHASLDERHRVGDRDLPRPLGEREALARRRDGPSLVHSRHG